MEETPKKIVEERVGERHTKNDCIGGYFQRGFLKDKEILRRGGEGGCMKWSNKILLSRPMMTVTVLSLEKNICLRFVS